tara:strand:- start:185 stop:466 length:282 start_codon:yes stop_codon:yes gene_type:complete
MKIKVKDHLSLNRFSLFKNNEKIEETSIKKELIDNAEAKKKIPKKNKFSDNLYKLIFPNIFVILTFFIYFKTLPAGFEPAAHCLEGSCSIQLS